jgi:tetratricopeptide (TPR) repeat protein
METNVARTLSIPSKNRILLALLVLGICGTLATGKHLYTIEQFNLAATASGKVSNDNFKFEAKFANAYHLAKNGRYQDASQLFGQLMEIPATKSQNSAVQYNLGNIFLMRGLMVNHNANEGGNGVVKDEAEYLINQAKMAYQQSLRLDNQFIDARYNLDRVLRLLPENSVAKDDQDELGIVMGNIPSGLP